MRREQPIEHFRFITLPRYAELAFLPSCAPSLRCYKLPKAQKVEVGFKQLANDIVGCVAAALVCTPPLDKSCMLLLME